MEETTKASMTKDEMIMELIELLKSNDRGRQAGDSYKFFVLSWVLINAVNVIDIIYHKQF